MSEAEVYSAGILHCSVCVPKGWTTEQIEDFVNMDNPILGTCIWEISEDKEFITGEPNPCQCKDNNGKSHYLMVC